MRNFNYPYFSRDIAEFWRRWHISQSTWFRDYVYIPLGGSKGDIWLRVRNIFIIFLVSGLWHGANWTFIAYGALNAIYFLPLMLSNNNRNNLEIVAQGKMLPTLRELSAMLMTFGLVVLTRVFFRAENIGHALGYLSEIFSPSLFTIPAFNGMMGALTTIALVIIFILIEWRGREQQYAIADLGLKWKRPVRYAAYYAIIMAIFWFGGNQQQFVYFQF